MCFRIISVPLSRLKVAPMIMLIRPSVLFWILCSHQLSICYIVSLRDTEDNNNSKCNDDNKKITNKTQSLASGCLQSRVVAPSRPVG